MLTSSPHQCPHCQCRESDTDVSGPEHRGHLAADSFMDGTYLGMLLTRYGLDHQSFARINNVQDRTVRRWIAGTSSIPYSAAYEADLMKEKAKAAVASIVTGPTSRVATFLDDERFHAAYPQYEMLPCSWWHCVVIDATNQRPDLIVEEDNCASGDTQTGHEEGASKVRTTLQVYQDTADRLDEWVWDEFERTGAKPHKIAMIENALTHHMPTAADAKTPKMPRASKVTKIYTEISMEARLNATRARKVRDNRGETVPVAWFYSEAVDRALQERAQGNVSR